MIFPPATDVCSSKVSSNATGSASGALGWSTRRTPPGSSARVSRRQTCSRRRGLNTCNAEKHIARSATPSSSSRSALVGTSRTRARMTGSAAIVVKNATRIDGDGSTAITGRSAKRCATTCAITPVPAAISSTPWVGDASSWSRSRVIRRWLASRLKRS